MKELPATETIGMTAFDYPNDQHPGYTNKIHHGNQHVPHPTNSAAKKIDHAKIMGQILRAK